MTAETLSFETSPGLQLVGDVYGNSGRPVMFLHGGGQTRHSWQATAQTLAKAGFRAIPFDQRGHGDSGRPQDLGYSFFDFAADSRSLALQLTRKFGAKPVVVGASLGGLSSLIGSALDADNPYAALVLVDVTPRMDPKGVAAVQGFMRGNAAAGFATVEEAAESIAAYLPHRPKPRSLSGLRKNLRLRDNGRYYWHWDPAFLDGPRPIETDRRGVEDTALKAAAALAVPSLLVRGQASELVQQEQAEEILRLAKGSEFVDVKDARHMVAGDSNGAFTTAVLEFLKRLQH
ncbi:MAG: alpha/beta fold hydrolase [Beijerinckiaceae bacterium]